MSKQSECHSVRPPYPAEIRRHGLGICRERGNTAGKLPLLFPDLESGDRIETDNLHGVSDFRRWGARRTNHQRVGVGENGKH